MDEKQLDGAETIVLWVAELGGFHGEFAVGVVSDRNTRVSIVSVYAVSGSTY
jgi:hypothetical protein